ncbi:MAG: type III-A CRISPR-associated RAMP protein Csm3 [Cryomorphaceae bacterium]|nr:type III-A CRISPR-associated RAMP protein Csm3 [Cryomorphaceae bacterium]
MKLLKKIQISCNIILETGLHIGDSKENVQIGGVDNSVIRRKDNNQPYIPGSSLKGKLRSLLEKANGENSDNKFKDTGGVVSKLFGSTPNKELNSEGNASRIIVRDAYLTNESVSLLDNSEFLDVPFAEVKVENSINRVIGKAEHPRQQERVPAGAVFYANLILNVFEGDNENTLMDELRKGFKLLELDYLGGSGSRGYGQVSFDNWQETVHDVIILDQSS